MGPGSAEQMLGASSLLGRVDWAEGGQVLGPRRQEASAPGHSVCPEARGHQASPADASHRCPSEVPLRPTSLTSHRLGIRVRHVSDGEAGGRCGRHGEPGEGCGWRGRRGQDRVSRVQCGHHSSLARRRREIIIPFEPTTCKSGHRVTFLIPSPSPHPPPPASGDITF